MSSAERLCHRLWFSKSLIRAALSLTLLALGTSAAMAQGYVYIQTNEGRFEGANTIRAFFRDTRGLLTELPSSPIATHGTGVHPTADLTLANLGPFDSDQALILNEAGDRLFGVNGGSDSVFVFNVGKNGTLTRVQGSPFSSFGVNPSSVGLSKNGILVVANKDYDLGRPGFNPATRQGSYITFLVNRKGQLGPLSGLVAGPVGGVGPGHATPTQALISKDGTLAFDANFFGLQVRSFRIGSNGQFQPADAQNIPPPGGTNGLGLAIPLGLQVHPTQPILYVGFVLDKAFGVYTFDQTGHLNFVKAVTNVGSGPCWILLNSAGDRLYTSNNFDNTVSVFDTSNPLNPVKLQQVTLAQGFGTPTAPTASPFSLALDKKGKFLHVLCQAAATGQDPFLANGLNVLRVNPDGRLAVVDFVPIPSYDGSRPQGIAAK